MQSFSIFHEVEIGCGGCRKRFKSKIPFAVNILSEPHLLASLQDLTLLSATCTHCSNTAQSPGLFLFHDPSKERFWFVIPDFLDTRYQLVRQAFQTTLKEYSAQFDDDERTRLKSLTPSIMPITAFLLQIESPVMRGVGTGLIHFTPFPRIELPDDHSRDVDPKDIPDLIDDYAIALAEGNHPKFFDSLWSLMGREFQHGSERSYLATERVETPKRPVGTYGIAEVLIFVGTSIAVPVFVGVLSSLLSTLVTQKILKRGELEAERERASSNKDPREELIKDRVSKLLEAMNNPMAPNDAVSIRIRVKETLKEYRFAGTFHEVVKQLRRFHDESLDSVRLPGDCHICNYVGEAYADMTLPHTEVGAITELADRYEKIFAEDTRVRFLEGESANEMHEAIGLCNEARNLMRQQKYEEAASVLQRGIRGEETSVELLYNHALCLAELGYEDGARFMLKQVLIRSMNLPPLSAAKDFVLGRLENAQTTTQRESGNEPESIIKSAIGE